MPTFWTSRAWSDSHSDLFIRNIYTGLDGDDTGAREYNEFAANNVRPTWPTLDEVLRWADQNPYPPGSSTLEVEDYQLSLDATIERNAGRCHLHVRPVDANGAVDPGGDPVEIPAAVKLATIMGAVTWARARNTPDGIAGTSELGNVVRVSGYDARAEALLAPHLALGLA